VTDNSCCTTITVTQPTTEVIQILTGPQGAQGPPGSQGPQGDSIFQPLDSTTYYTTSSIQITGSFTGSFVGDGSQLVGIVSSKWSGSNPITRNSDVEITGSLTVVNGITASLEGTSSYALTASYVENAASSEGTITYIFNGFGGTIVAGYQYDYLIVPFSCSIQNWYAVSDVVGSTEIDIWRANGAIPTASDSIVGGNYITFTSQQINSDSTLLGWTSSLNPGDILNFDVRSASLMASLTIVMKILK